MLDFLVCSCQKDPGRIQYPPFSQTSPIYNSNVMEQEPFGDSLDEWLVRPETVNLSQQPRIQNACNY